MSEALFVEDVSSETLASRPPAPSPKIKKQISCIKNTTKDNTTIGNGTRDCWHEPRTALPTDVLSPPGPGSKIHQTVVSCLLHTINVPLKTEIGFSAAGTRPDGSAYRFSLGPQDLARQFKKQTWRLAYKKPSRSFWERPQNLWQGP